MRELLEYVFTQECYYKISSNVPEFSIYFRVENNLINVIHLVDCRNGLLFTQSQYQILKEKVYALFADKGAANIHMLSLFISSREETVQEACGEAPFCWRIEPESGRLLVQEGRAEDFYGLRGKLENALCHREELEKAMRERARQQAAQKETEEMKKFSQAWWKEQPFICSGIVAINMLVFLLCAFSGELLYNIGILYGPSVLENGEYYRFFTAMFLHGDVHHLASNMMMLFFLGEMVEKEMGHVRYLLLYLLSGLAGGMLSVWYGYASGNMAGSIGASGAVFGVMGAFAFLVLSHRGKWQQVTYGRMLFLVVYSLYSGFTGTNTDNAAHVGGLLGGFLISIAGYLLPGRKMHTGEKKNEN